MKSGKTHQDGWPALTDTAALALTPARAKLASVNLCKLSTALHLLVLHPVSRVLWLPKRNGWSYLTCFVQSRGCLWCCVKISNTEMLNILQRIYSDYRTFFNVDYSQLEQKLSVHFQHRPPRKVRLYLSLLARL